MSINVELIAKHGAGRRHTIGTVESLEEATRLVKQLDARFELWEAAGFPPLSAYDVLTDVLKSYEGCEIEAVFSDGQVYLFTDEWIRV